MFVDGSPSDFKQLSGRAKEKEFFVFGWCTNNVRAKNFSGFGLVVELKTQMQ